MPQEKPFIFIRDIPGRRKDLLELAQEVESRGFPGVMSPSTGDNIALSLAVLQRTERIEVGTGIANIYTRHPSEMAAASSLIAELHPGRFILGIGVSHRPTHQRLGVDTGKPLGDSRDYVAVIREQWQGRPAPTLMLAALRKRMTTLAGEISEGVMWANGVRSHMAFSLSQLPGDLADDFIVSNVVPACVSENVAEAREVTRRHLTGYMRLPNYQNYYLEAGYEVEIKAAKQAIAQGDEDGLLTSISDSLLDDIAVYGTAADVREEFAAWIDAGMTHMALNPVPADNLFKGAHEIMSAFDESGSIRGR